METVIKLFLQDIDDVYISKLEFWFFSRDKGKLRVKDFSCKVNKSREALRNLLYIQLDSNHKLG